MKKLELQLLAILLFSACQKEISGLNSAKESMAEVSICDQVWMVKNLDVDRYRNGDPIPQITDLTEWETLTTGAWCYYENKSANGLIYGKLYNWYAVNDPRGLAPEGWHIPNNAEWIALADCLGGNSVAGGALKSTGTIEDGTGLWLAPNVGATNSSGFTGLPGGFNFGIKGFNSLGYFGTWWSATENGPNDAYWLDIASKNASVSAPHDVSGPKFIGLSVRCVKD